MSRPSVSGLVLGAVGAALVALGVVLSSPPMVGIGAGLVAALVLSLVLSAGRPRLDVRHEVRPERLKVGEQAEVTLAVTNAASRRSRRVIVHEPFGTRVVTIVVPRLDPGASHRHVEHIDATERGRIAVGPLRVGWGDPLGATTGGARLGRTSHVVVHPRTHELSPFAVGRMRDLDGPTSSLAPEGGVAFHTLRAYAPGDDLRLVHWRSSARVGQLMVRKNVDTDQPNAVILLDTRADRYDGRGFDEAVEVAASFVASCAATNALVALATADPVAPVERGAHDGREWGLLDRLAVAQPSGELSLPAAIERLAESESARSLVIVTGSVGSEDLEAMAGAGVRYGGVSTASLTAGPQGVEEVAGAVVFRARTARGFADRWNGVAR
ncbi:MAG: DUF58 domain-containing protein [Actinomycetota bacterium]|nr:DUF58 domain-containing protein [Actinomycetota bacterium]